MIEPAGSLSQRNPGARRRRRAICLWVLLVIALGAAYRLWLAATLPVGYDEVFVMAVGLDDIRSSGTTTRLMEMLFFLPIRRSNGVTPLWWWVQYPSEFIGPAISLFALRVMPVTLGLLTPPLTWFLFRRRIGRGPAAILVTFVAACDILSFCNARAEFTESLLVPLTLIAVSRVGRPNRPVLCGAVWFAILMTHLGKGLFIVTALIAAEAVALWLARPPTRRSLHRYALSIGTGVLPLVLWLAVVNHFVFAGDPIRTDYRPEEGVTSIVDAVRKLTIDYPRTKQAMVAEPFDALEPYLDAVVWPTTAITGPWLLVACMVAATDAFRRPQRLGRRRRAAAALAVTALVFATIMILRGTCAGRFHLMYLPLAWTAAATTLWRLRRISHNSVMYVFVLSWLIVVAFTCAWKDWHARTLSASRWLVAAVCVVPASVALWLGMWFVPRVRRLGTPIVYLALCGVGVVIAGPVFWGPWARFEPFRSGDPEQPNLELVALDDYRSGRKDFPEPESGTLTLYLANFYMVGDRNLTRALYFSELAVERDPDNPRSWYYLGEVYRRAGRSAEDVDRSWSVAVRLDPENEKLVRVVDAWRAAHAAELGAPSE
jgi:hypothetical protein